MTTSAPCSIGLKIEGTGKGGVHQQRESLFLRRVCDGPEIDHPHQRIGGRLDEDRASGLPHRLAPVPRLLGIHVCHIDPESGQLLIEQVLGASIDPAAGDQVIAWTQHRQVSQRGGTHAAGHEDGILGALEQGVLLGQRELIGIVTVAAVEHLLVAADGIGEGAALLNGGGHRRPVRPPLRNAMDGGGGKPLPPAHAVGRG